MWTAFPPSDYYAGSAPPGTHSRRRTCPPPAWPAGGRATPDGSHVHHLTARQGRCPAIPLRPRHAYAADLHRGLPGRRHKPAKKFPTHRVGARRIPAHIRQVGAGGVPLRGVRTLVPHVHLPVLLAGPGPSGSTGPSRRCRGCCPPSPAPPGSGCPQLHRAAATTRQTRSLTSSRSDGASWRSRSATHNWLGLLAEKSRSTRSAGRAAVGSGVVVLWDLPRRTPQGPAHPSAARPCSGPPRSLAAKLPPHLAGAVDPEVGGVDPADPGLQLLVAAAAGRGRTTAAGVVGGRGDQ
jgi:hypothetical protein